jgi:pimeloyl-ACP methyl ester carboxylesterase
MKKLLIVIVVFFALVIIFLSGPMPPRNIISPILPGLDITIENVEGFVKNKEASFDIRHDNQARIVWNNDSLKTKTGTSVLYLHGFCASWYEGHPLHVNMGKALNANVYLSRLHDHGLDTNEGLFDMRPDRLYESAKEALLVASALGEKVVIIGTSTGGTLALMLAADFPELVDALILLSPNIAINNPASFLLGLPWGLQIARLTGDGGKYRKLGPATDVENKYWYRTYRWEGVIYLYQLIQKTMKTELFEQVTQPVFLGYYYKNDEEQDEVVKVDAMLEMYDQLGTPDHLKQKTSFPHAALHVIGCKDLSGSYDDVEMATIDFVEQLLLN